MKSELPPRYEPLPIRLRPSRGESISSYIRRLARANHLKPSFLHCYLCGPPQWFGKPRLENLAVTTGHTPQALQRALADVNSLRGSDTTRPPRRYPRKNPSTQGWQHLARRIARDAQRGTPIRALAQRHHLRPWEIRLALEIPRLTSPESHQLSDPITGDLADLIESMNSKGLNRRQIWQKLFDHHDHLVTYDSLNYYFRTTRRR